MHYPPSIWTVVIFLTLLSKFTGGSVIRKAKQNLHHHMTRREIQYYFGVNDHSEIPEYHVTTPRQIESNGRAMFRHRRSVSHPDVAHYKLHAFGSNLQLRLKRNLMLMAPNLVIERHHQDGAVTTHPAPKNKFYLGQVSSDPDSLVALRSDGGLTGMIRTSEDTLFVQPLPAHLAKRVRRSAVTPHLIYRLPSLKQRASGFETKKSVNNRVKRSTQRGIDSSGKKFKFMEAALVVPQHFVDKYGEDRFATVLLVIANMVAGMYQDPSMGKFKVYYVVTKISHIKSVQKTLGFNTTDGPAKKLNQLLSWAAPSMTKDDTDPAQFDVFSYITDKVVGGRALANHMCATKRPNGNINSDVGLQTALVVAHETGHNMYLNHDETSECPSMRNIMSGTLPTGIYAATWSNCSRRVIEAFLGNDIRSKCFDDSPFDRQHPTLAPSNYHKLPGEVFDGDDQCEFQYGPGYKISPYRKGICNTLYCIRNGVELSRLAPVADGTACGTRHWCIGGKCQDNGKKRIAGGWSAWSSSYSKCTRVCGGGVHFRHRTCTNPPAANDGEPCEGPDKDYRICNSQPCAVGIPSLAQEQCTKKKPGSVPYYQSNPCFLFCRTGSSAVGKGTVTDGTRCNGNQGNPNVCIHGKCRNVAPCTNKLDSNALVDRCGICEGDGDTCFKVKANYTKQHTVSGPENADLIAELPAGTSDVYFQMRKRTFNYLGVQAKNGTYLVGGNLGLGSQRVNVANTTIVFTHNRNRKRQYKDQITIAGPTNAFLKVVYIFTQGANPGLDYNFVRKDRPLENKYEWKIDPWSSCSGTCGQGVRKRSMRCIRSDDLSPASDKACGVKPPTEEQCPLPKECPSDWYKDWTDCSRSCGHGKQTRIVQCRIKLDGNTYKPSNKCPENTRPNITEPPRSCNSFACFADWDTHEGLPPEECGEPIDPDTLFCYRMDQFGQKDLVPDHLCRQAKPTRLPCTTPSTPSTRPTSATTSKPKTTKHSQAAQAQCSVILTLLVLLLHLT